MGARSASSGGVPDAVFVAADPGAGVIGDGVVKDIGAGAAIGELTVVIGRNADGEELAAGAACPPTIAANPDSADSVTCRYAAWLSNIERWKAMCVSASCCWLSWNACSHASDATAGDCAWASCGIDAFANEGAAAGFGFTIFPLCISDTAGRSGLGRGSACWSAGGG